MSDAMKKKKQERCFSKLTIISSAKLYNFVFSFPVSITSITLVPFFFFCHTGYDFSKCSIQEWY